MKRYYGIWILIGVSLICLAFLGGLFLGRNLSGSGILVSATPTAPLNTSAATGPAAAGSQLVDLNSATLAQLQTLPGIGPVLAQRILDYRTQNGPFSTVADLANVNGIGTKRLEAILDFVTVGG